MIRHLLPVLLILGIIGCKPEPEHIEKGNVAVIGNWKPDGLKLRDVWVYTPPNYDSTASYPIIFMHDGQMLFDSTSTWNGQEWGVDEWMDQLIHEGKVQHCVIVGIDNSGHHRRSEYFPEVPFHQLPDSLRNHLLEIDMEGDARADEYLHFIVNELKPFIQNTYAVSKNPDETYVMGSSMGGLISCYALTQYPDHFGGAACLSTHWLGSSNRADSITPHTLIHYLGNNLSDSADFKLYFDHGQLGLDSLYAPHQRKMDSILSHREVAFSTYVIESGDHNEKSWNARLDKPLIYLIGAAEED